MLGYCTLILLCQLAGECITYTTKIPVPGPVIGMVILLGILMRRNRMPVNLEKVAGILHRYLPLLFVPAGVGIIANVNLLKRFWVPIAGAIFLGTIVTIAVTGIVMRSFHRSKIPLETEGRQ